MAAEHKKTVSLGGLEWMADDDPENPANFSKFKKWFIVTAGTICTINCCMGSSLPSGGLTYIGEEYNIKDHNSLVLLNSLYVIGYVFGPPIWGPMSESVGRRPVLMLTYFMYCIWTMACALTPNYAALLVFRLLSGIFAAAANAVPGAINADIFTNVSERGQAMSLVMYITTFGPQCGPIISGWLSPLGWRWTFWAGFIMAMIGVPFMALLPETFVPVLLARRHKKQAKAAADEEQGEKDSLSPARQASKAEIYARPFVMLYREPIILFTSLYLSLVYGIIYLFFQAFPIVWGDEYGLSTGMASFPFVGVLIGATIAYCGFFWYSPFHAKAEASGKAWAQIEEYRRLPLACAAGPGLVIGMFWLAWTSYKSLGPVVPMVGTVFFGFGFQLIFLAMLNYLTDVYKQFSASAQAAASMTRSVFAVCLPFATTSMYGKLGVHWATSLLGFLTLMMSVIPFGFIRYRYYIRERSPFCKILEQGVHPQNDTETMFTDSEPQTRVPTRAPSRTPSRAPSRAPSEKTLVVPQTKAVKADA